ncbi:Extensin-like protein C-terminus [Friedmanniella luteola]|uniref:Extensin-like protein C-terminus n=1 Tax=Friedmanniella luteola TaxID=546871 RepID=A0A1H1Y202_9ACTN|nr:extensin family protein [Friedmanniella luteola]SDT15036.1 Extensin-like protein C-terminus [Friedmanniella luteola]
MPEPLTRRRLLGLGAGLGSALAIGATAACGTVPDPGAGVPERGASATCVPRSALASHRTVAGLPLVYEPDQRRSAFRFDTGFFTRLEDWAGGLADVLPAAPEELRTYGSWTDGGTACDSWHHAGRAFDLARVRLADGSEVSCRQDRWRSLEGARLDEARRRYWALAAGLHARFSYVLTYLYDAQHANHVHVDNGRSGDGDPTFSPRSGVQVDVVQAVCRYLWAQPVELTGRWDAATRRGVAAVLDSLGLDDDLGAAGSWTGLMTAAAARGRD